MATVLAMKLRRVNMGLEEGIIKNRSSSYVPNGKMVKVKGLCAELAWDNFDINMQTFSGLDTIHHTYGICYQNIPPEIPKMITSTNDITSPLAKSKKHCFSKVVTQEPQQLEPYWRKPKCVGHDFQKQAFFPPETYSYFSKMNTLWSLAKCLLPNTLLFWTGWNS